MAAIKKTNTYISTMKKYNIAVSSMVLERREQSSENHLLDFDVDEATEISFEQIASKMTFVPKNIKLYSF